MKSSSSFRITLLYGSIFLVAFVLVVRLYSLQVMDGEAYSDQANRQYTAPERGMFNRGSIYFKDKDGNLVSAATLKTGYILAINPKGIENAKDTYEKISKILKIDAGTFYNKVNKKNDPYEEIATHLDKKIADKIKALKLNGVKLYKQRWRFYPGGTLAAQTLGFIGYEGNSLAGRYGIERYYEDFLKRDNKSLYINFFAEVFSNIGKSLSGKKEEGDVILGIEPSVQFYLESELKKAKEKWKSDEGVGVVIDPNNGQIYALAIDPSFNLNDFRDGKLSTFGNPFVEEVREMGSIIKALTMSIGLDTGSVTAKTTYDDRGHIFLDGSKISNYDGRARGVIPMQQILSQSLNVGAAFVESKIGNKKFAKYMMNLGLGEETGIDLPNETFGLVSNLKSPRDLEYATASFGQGIALTPVETVRALCTLANGGKLITPHLATDIRYRTGVTRELIFPEGKRIFKKSTTDEITRMLVKVVDEALMGGTVKLKHYSIAAKTGTAQMAKENGRGYYKDKYLHSFFGYFPAYKPRFLIFFYLVNPQGTDYASHTLTTPFMNMVKFLINYYEIPPDR